MFDKYINYNKMVEEMIKSRNDNAIALESLKHQYEQLLNNKQFEEKSNMTAIKKGDLPLCGAATLHRDTIANRIQELTLEIELYDSAWEQLTTHEKRILEVFFSTGTKKRQSAVDLLCEEFEREPATIYRKKDEALSRFKRLLFG